MQGSQRRPIPPTRPPQDKAHVVEPAQAQTQAAHSATGDEASARQTALDPAVVHALTNLLELLRRYMMAWDESPHTRVHPVAHGSQALQALTTGLT
eukprot:2005368-Amphidinium_carterae.1